MLSDSNYHDWSFNITARLCSKGLWMLVNGKKKHLSASADQEKWDLDQEMAAGLIASTLEPGQHVHIQGLEDDLVKMWDALHRVYVQQQAGTCFNAYDALFNIQKQPDETHKLLITQVTTAMQLLKSSSIMLEKNNQTGD